MTDVLVKLDNIHTLNQSSHLDTSSPSLNLLSETRRGDPSQALRFNQVQHTKRRQSQIWETPNKLWQSPRLHDWSASSDSRVAFVTAGFRARPAMRHFSLIVIHTFRPTRFPYYGRFSRQRPAANSLGSALSISSSISRCRPCSCREAR